METTGEAASRDFHMSAEEFRRHGRAVVDWIANYMENVESYPVLSRLTPGAVRALLPENPPDEGEPFQAILADVDRVILPGITHWQSPRFHAFFPANASGPSILGELLSAGLGVQGMLWITSPACTELETHVLDWLVDMLDLPQKFKSSGQGGGVIQDTASSATLCALLAGRERTLQRPGRRCDPSKLVAYASTQAHLSVEKAMRIAGLGSDRLRLIEVDEKHAMRAHELEDRIASDLGAGFTPCFVCATLGTTSSNAFDSLPAIGAVARKHGIWLHVDAAMSGTAALCPEFRYIHAGLELADSYCFNPHKWMFTNFDCDCFYVADRHSLISAFSILPDYLKNRATSSGDVIDYRDWHVPLGRRFRALKLWFVIRWYGVEGLRHHVREHVRLAQEFASWVDADARFERVAPAPLNLVCFRIDGTEALNRALLEELNAGGRLYLTQARLGGRLCLRFCVGQTHTKRRHVTEAWERIQEVATRLHSNS